MTQQEEIISELKKINEGITTLNNNVYDFLKDMLTVLRDIERK